MGQHPIPDPYRDEDQDLEELGTPVYDGTGLSVRALTADELQQFLDAHHGRPERLGSGRAALDPPFGSTNAEEKALVNGSGDRVPPHHEPLGRAGTARPEQPALDSPPGHPAGVPRTPPAAEGEPLGPLPWAGAEPGAGGLGRPGRSALAHYRRRRAQELAGWTRSLAWRVPLVVAAGLAAGALAAQAGLARTLTTPAGLAAAALLAWRLRFRPSEQARSWQRGAHGEQQTARLLDRLTRDGFIVFHDLAMPGSPANVDHLVIGPTGVFVIDSKQWTGGVQQSADGLVWHNHYRLDRTLETVRWGADTIGWLLGTRAVALLCVHGAHVQGGGIDTQGVAIVPAHLLRSALGCDRVLSDADVALLAATARARLRSASIHPAT